MKLKLKGIWKELYDTIWHELETFVAIAAYMMLALIVSLMAQIVTKHLLFTAFVMVASAITFSCLVVTMPQGTLKEKLRINSKTAFFLLGLLTGIITLLLANQFVRSFLSGFLFLAIFLVVIQISLYKIERKYGRFIQYISGVGVAMAAGLVYFLLPP